MEVKDIEKVVQNQFDENGITDLMEYDGNGIAELIEDCLNELNVQVDYRYGEEISDGKYLIVVGYGETNFQHEMKAWWGVDEVVEYIQDFLEEIK